jgi:hypothetical protein
VTGLTPYDLTRPCVCASRVGFYDLTQPITDRDKTFSHPNSPTAHLFFLAVPRSSKSQVSPRESSSIKTRTHHKSQRWESYTRATGMELDRHVGLFPSITHSSSTVSGRSTRIPTTQNGPVTPTRSDRRSSEPRAGNLASTLELRMRRTPSCTPPRTPPTFESCSRMI